MKLPITVVVPVKNEAKNLKLCLEKIRPHFQSVVVVDSGSTDATAEIASECGALVLQFEWNGSFPKKRNWILRTHSFETEWVLFLDADEFVTAEVIDELKETLPKTEHAGFWLRFDNWFAGQPLLYGDPMRKLALFRVGAGEYERFPEVSWSHLDMEIHEHPVLNGSTGELRSSIEHRDYRGFAHYIAKHNDYSSWEAKRYKWLKSSSTDQWEKLTGRQRFKYQNLDKWWLGLFYFFIAYIVKRGFMDGRAGWTFNRLKLQYFNDIRLKIREMS